MPSLATCCFGFSGVVAASLAFALRRGFSKQNKWPKVKGVVTISRVEFMWETYRANIQYSYSVNGNQFHGQTVRSAIVQFNWKAPAKRVCDKYPEGTVIDVFISPDDPAASVLEIGGESITAMLFAGIAVIMLLIFFFLWILGLQ